MKTRETRWIYRGFFLLKITIMKKKLIIKNLKYCFDLGLTFSDLAVIEKAFLKTELERIFKSGGFVVFNQELQNEYLKNECLDLDFVFDGARTTKEGENHVYFVCKLVQRV
jgi:hypothetical protein